MRRLLSWLRREDGNALMFVAIGLPAILIVFAIVVDVGNWYVHRRALQNQADAAVFAGSQHWGSCFKTVTTSPPWQPMLDEAHLYSGETGYAKNWNPRIGGALQGSFGVLFNSTLWPINQPNSSGPDDTPSDPCTLVTGADGQGHYIFDVKATEANLPLIFGHALPGVPQPSLHVTARTELRQVKSLSGLLPIGVTDPSPIWMYAQFEDEDNGNAALTSWIPLCKIGRPGCAGSSPGGDEYWTSQVTTPVSIPTATKHIGVRLKYVWGGSNPNPDCGSSALVDCWYNVPSATNAVGLEHIRAWQTGQTGPHLNNVWMLPGSCTDGYFASDPCDAGIQAEVDLGSNHPLGSAWSSGQCATGCAQVWATIDGGNTKYQLNPPGTLNATGINTWTLPSGITLPSAGPHTIALSWQWKQTAVGPQCASPTCTANNSFNNGNPVQRAFVADHGATSGPVEGITIWSNTVTGGANSFPQGTTQNLGVTVRNPCFDTQKADPTCPLVYLRVSASATGSESQSLDCDPAFPNIKDEIAKGCNPGYTIYPKASGSSPCPTQSVLWSNPNPPNLWDCVAVQTGTGDLEGGLAARIGTDSTTCGNHWPNYPDNDRRQVPLFLVPYSAFSSPGSNKTYPVIGFAAFYITGYFHDPCPGATTSGLKQGMIPGYFITYLSADKGATPSSHPCDPLELLPCIPVLVK